MCVCTHILVSLYYEYYKSNITSKTNKLNLPVTLLSLSSLLTANDKTEKATVTATFTARICRYACIW